MGGRACWYLVVSGGEVFYCHDPCRVSDIGPLYIHTFVKTNICITLTACRISSETWNRACPSWRLHRLSNYHSMKCFPEGFRKSTRVASRVSCTKLLASHIKIFHDTQSTKAISRTVSFPVASRLQIQRHPIFPFILSQPRAARPVF